MCCHCRLLRPASAHCPSRLKLPIARRHRCGHCRPAPLRYSSAHCLFASCAADGIVRPPSDLVRFRTLVVHFVARDRTGMSSPVAAHLASTPGRLPMALDYRVCRRVPSQRSSQGSFPLCAPDRRAPSRKRTGSIRKTCRPSDHGSTSFRSP